jgi:hypothetical protein
VPESMGPQKQEYSWDEIRYFQLRGQLLMSSRRLSPIWSMRHQRFEKLRHLVWTVAKTATTSKWMQQGMVAHLVSDFTAESFGRAEHLSQKSNTKPLAIFQHFKLPRNCGGYTDLTTPYALWNSAALHHEKLIKTN